MIKKLNKLKDFGVFHDFTWNGLEEFKRFNLIYGWNYSGKTTLSRVFQCFELEKLHDDCQQAVFGLEYEDGNTYDQSQLTQPFIIRVFNSDFTKDNLKWEMEEGIEPVLLIGEENIELEKQLKQGSIELEEKEKQINDLQRYIFGKGTEFDTELTNKARSIKTSLNILNYDKRNLDPVVKAVSENPEDHILSDEQIQEVIQIYQSTEKKDIIPEILFPIPDTSNLYNQVNQLLERIATANVIDKLKEDVNLEKWVKEGLSLHIDKSICQFCGNELPEDLLDNLNKHFSEEYSHLINEIDQLINVLNQNKVTVELPDSARFYTELQKNYEQACENLITAIKTVNIFINGLVDKLEDKKTKPFERVASDLSCINTDNIAKETKNISEMIEKHKQKTEGFETERNIAKDKLIKHWASEYAIQVKYDETIKEIEDKQSVLRTQRTELATIKGKIQLIERKLSDVVKGAGKINEYLRGYFGTDEIQMAVAEDDKYFKLERTGHPAKNLSEGEKTAIAFSHFMAKLEENANDLSQTIIFVDDPVSSLDSNHLFYTYSFIKTKLSSCKQLFISTHNYEFFNLVKEWFRDVKITEGDKAFYLVEKIKNGEDKPFESTLFVYLNCFSPIIHAFIFEIQHVYGEVITNYIFL